MVWHTIYGSRRLLSHASTRLMTMGETENMLVGGIPWVVFSSTYTPLVLHLFYKHNACTCASMHNNNYSLNFVCRLGHITRSGSYQNNIQSCMHVNHFAASYFRATRLAIAPLRSVPWSLSMLFWVGSGMIKHHLLTNSSLVYVLSSLLLQFGRTHPMIRGGYGKWHSDTWDLHQVGYLKVVYANKYFFIVLLHLCSSASEITSVMSKVDLELRRIHDNLANEDKAESVRYRNIDHAISSYTFPGVYSLFLSIYSKSWMWSFVCFGLVSMQTSTVAIVSAVAAIGALVVTGLTATVCVYCCMVKYKMCTPIYDPIQNPPPNCRVYTYDFEVCALDVRILCMYNYACVCLYCQRHQGTICTIWLYNDSTFVQLQLGQLPYVYKTKYVYNGIQQHAQSLKPIKANVGWQKMHAYTLYRKFSNVQTHWVR